MASSKLTLIGLYQYDDSIFDDLLVPDPMDKETLINNILLESSEFELMYPSLPLLKNAIKLWSNKWNRTLSKWAEDINLEYSPLDNYDRVEEWTDTHKGTIKNTGSASGTNKTTSSGSTSGDEKISAYNSDAMRNNTASSGSSSSDTNNQTSANNSDITENDLIDVHTSRMRGNIGTTTSQQMLESQLKIDEWNWYVHVTDLFLNEFCVMVYV